VMSEAGDGKAPSGLIQFGGHFTTTAPQL